jgi:DNA-binding response OmpR family regulator
VATGEEAIEYVNQRGRFQSVGPVSLVIMDLNLHGMTGFDLLKDLRAERSAKILPIVVLSSSRQTSDINRCYELGANSYIAKSMSFESFVGKVATVVRYWFDTVEQPNTGV